MKKPVSGRSDAALFLGHAHCMDVPVSPRRRTGKSHKSATPASAKTSQPLFLDAVIGGHRAHLYNPKAGRVSERGMQLRVATMLASKGVLVLVHNVEACYRCRAKPTRRVGLGRGASDLLCVVPPFGRLLAIEMKKPGYSPSDVDPDQRKWLATVRRYGAVTGIASSEEEALALLEEARRG